MLFLYYLSQLRAMIYVAPVLLLAITGHEYAHGWVSDRLGDPTPRQSGRLTWNPFCHLDLFGAICLAFFHVGWAKPVPINPNYYQNRKKGIILVSLAGPAANLILAFLSMFTAGVLIKLQFLDTFLGTHLCLLAYYSAVVNTGLAMFNLIPLPPLDGSNVFGELFWRAASVYRRWQPYWRIILAFLVLTGVLGRPLSLLNEKVIGEMWDIVRRVLRLRFSTGIPDITV